MTTTRVEPVTREWLEKRLAKSPPDNESRTRGYALVNVLAPEQFQAAHVPGSINIPKGSEAEFERRFDRSKEIVLYCASRRCDAAATVGQRLLERGFTNVRDYEAGIEDWQRAHGAEGQRPLEA